MHAFLGSTTERVLRTAPCPVLVVREKERASAKERARSGRTPLQFRKVLVPVDFSQNSRLGVEYGLRFVREFGAGIILFHSVFVPPLVLGDESTAGYLPNLIPMKQEHAAQGRACSAARLQETRGSARRRGREWKQPEPQFPVPNYCDYLTLLRNK